MLWLAVTNSAYRLGVTAHEVRRLGGFRWYWRLRLALFLNQFTPGPLPARRYPPPDKPLPTHPLVDDLLYGETPILTAWQICRRLNLSNQDAIVDLGAGIGLPLLVACLGFGASGLGWEIVPHRLLRARMLAANLQVDRLHFQDQDFLESPLPDGNVYWLNPTALHDDSWRRLCDKLAQLPVGTRAISLTLALPKTQWRTLHREDYPFSWGRTPTYFQERTEE